MVKKVKDFIHLTKIIMKLFHCKSCKKNKVIIFSIKFIEILKERNNKLIIMEVQKETKLGLVMLKCRQMKINLNIYL